MSLRTVVLVLFFLFTMGLRIEHRVVFYDLGYDKTRQMTLAGNLIRNNGISDCIVTSDDLSNVVCKPQTWWAIGYPLALSLLHNLTGDFLLSDQVLIYLGLLIFFFSSYYIYNVFEGAKNVISPFVLFLIFSAFSFAPFHYLSTTDLLSMAFFLAGTATALRILGGNGIPASILTALFFFLSAIFKFSFYPFLAVVPAALFVMLALTREIRLLYSIVAYFLVLAFAFGLTEALFPGHLLSQNIDGLQRGWNWSHILAFDPFAIKAFFFLETVLSKLSPYPLFEYIVSIGLMALSAALVICTVYFGLRQQIKGTVANASQKLRFLYLMGSITIVANITFLTLLSLRMPVFPQQNNPDWTFVWENRYFAPAAFFLIIFVFSLIFRSEGSKLLRIAARGLVGAAIVYAFAYWSWKHLDILVNNRLQGTFYAEPKESVLIGNFIRDYIATESRPVVLGFLNEGEAYGASRLERKVPKPSHFLSRFDEDYRGDTELTTSRPVILFFVVPNEPGTTKGSFMSRRNALKVLSLSKSDLYKIEVTPE